MVMDTCNAKPHRSLVTPEETPFGACNYRELADIQISSLREKRTFCSPANWDDLAQCQVGHTFQSIGRVVFSSTSDSFTFQVSENEQIKYL